MKKKFDVNTAKKIINEYADKLNFYIKENNNLKAELDDLSITLNLNKELLFKHISENKGELIFQDLKIENERLTDNLEKIYKEKIILEKKIYKIEQALNEKIISENESISRLKDQLFLLDNKLREKDNKITSMKNQLEKFYYDSSSKIELYIAEPERNNLEIYNELCCMKELYYKLLKMLNLEKLKNSKLENTIKDYKEKDNSKVKKKPSILSIDISSESDLSNKSDVNDNLESPIVKIPDKIKMIKQISQLNKSVDVPKLDLSKVKNKYATSSNNINIIDTIKCQDNNEEYIEKLKFQLKVCKNTIKIYKKNFEKLKNTLKSHKQELVIARCKIEVLEKKLGSSTYEGSLKNINNTSMVYYLLFRIFI